MGNSSLSHCMICERVLKDTLSVVHADCVPLDKLIMLCNCGEFIVVNAAEIDDMVGFLNVTMEEQKADLLKPSGGQFIIMSECTWCNDQTDGENFQIIFTYSRHSEAN